MKNLKPILALLSLLPCSLALAAENDFLTRHQIKIDGPNADQALSETTADLMSVFDRFQPRLDSGSTIVSPLKVRGSKARPVVQVSVQKCLMGIACASVDLVGEASLAPSAGPCTKNFKLHVDLSRSSGTLSGTYDAIDASLCYQKNANGGGTLSLSQSARRASRYEPGSTQELILGFMKQQAPQITQAFRETIRSNADVAIAKAN